jgi:hypothetical protein
MAAAAMALLVLAGCGGTSRHTATTSNEKVLTRAQSQRLVEWAGSLRACLRARRFSLGEPAVARTHIDLAVPDGTAFKALVRAGIACGDSLGGPPAASSLQTFADRVVLYLPKRCLLDPDVEA